MGPQADSHDLAHAFARAREADIVALRPCDWIRIGGALRIAAKAGALNKPFKDGAGVPGAGFRGAFPVFGISVALRSDDLTEIIYFYCEDEAARRAQSWSVRW